MFQLVWVQSGASIVVRCNLVVVGAKSRWAVGQNPMAMAKPLHTVQSDVSGSLFGI